MPLFYMYTTYVYIYIKHKTEKIKQNFTAQTNWNNLFEKKKKKKILRA